MGLILDKLAGQNATPISESISGNCTNTAHDGIDQNPIVGLITRPSQTRKPTEICPRTCLILYIWVAHSTSAGIIVLRGVNMTSIRDLDLSKYRILEQDAFYIPDFITVCSAKMFPRRMTKFQIG